MIRRAVRRRVVVGGRRLRGLTGTVHTRCIESCATDELWRRRGAATRAARCIQPTRGALATHRRAAATIIAHAALPR